MLSYKISIELVKKTSSFTVTLILDLNAIAIASLGLEERVISQLTVVNTMLAKYVLSLISEIFTS